MKAVALSVFISAYLYSTDKMIDPPDRPLMALLNMGIYAVGLWSVLFRGSR
jgi:hypothetical protein